MITPNTVDYYSRYMSRLFDERKIIKNSTVWQRFFGNPANNGSETVYSPNSEVVDIDIMRGNKRTAALVHRGTDSRPLNLMANTVTQNYSSFSRVFPLAEELGDITASQINKRMAGENPYSGMARADRTRQLAAEHHTEHINRYVRLFEVLCGFSLLGGQMPAILGTTNADLIYDFARNAGHIVTPAIPWNVVGADILGDIDAGCRAVFQNGNARANCFFLGQNVAPIFFNNATIQAFADILGFSFIFAGMNNQVPTNLKPLEDSGATFMGTLFTPEGNKLSIFVYDGIVDDATGQPQHLMPLNSAFLASYGARCDRYFGPSERLEIDSTDVAWMVEKLGINPNAPMMPSENIIGAGIVDPRMFYFDAYKATDRKKVTIRTESAPIFATTQTDAFYTFLDVLEVNS